MEFQCPPDDLAAEGIEHNRQISELLGKVQIGDVCDPKLVNPCQFHPPGQVWDDAPAMLGIGGPGYERPIAQT